MGIALLLVSQALFQHDGGRRSVPVTGQPLPLISKGGTSTFINCAYIGMILSVSRYTAKLEEQRAHDAQVTDADRSRNARTRNNRPIAKHRAAAEPTAKILNSDAEFE